MAPSRGYIHVQRVMISTVAINDTALVCLASDGQFDTSLSSRKGVVSLQMELLYASAQELLMVIDNSLYPIHNLDIALLSARSMD